MWANGMGRPRTDPVDCGSGGTNSLRPCVWASALQVLSLLDVTLLAAVLCRRLRLIREKCFLTQSVLVDPETQ